MAVNEDALCQVLAGVQAGKEYGNIHAGLVQRIAMQELAKGRKIKEAIKTTRSKLHQIGGAYFPQALDYPALIDELSRLPGNTAEETLLAYCSKVMQLHTSTRERLPILEDFFKLSLVSLAPLQSILDIGCGLNPLALPWMPINQATEYHGIDIYRDMAEFLNRFFEHTGYRGIVEVGDVSQPLPKRRVQLALLLKVLPCFDQQDKHASRNLIETINAENILVSFPVHSLGGRKKGMSQFYEEQFRSMLSGQEWSIQRFEFSSELAFLIRRQT